MHTLRRTATVLIWPAIAWLGACDQANTPTTPRDGVVPEFGVGVGTLPGKATGGGQILVEGGTGTFGFNARREPAPDNAVSGHLNYVNHVSGVHLNCEVESGGLITPAGQEPGAGSFGGYECTPNSTFSDFTFDIVDAGEPGRNDSFIIRYNGGTIVEGGIIRSGNIQIHNK